MLLQDTPSGLGPGPMTEWDPGLTTVVVLLLLFLVGSTAVRAVPRLRVGDARSRQRWRSLVSWWILVAAFVAILRVGPEAASLLMASLSLLLLHEALRLVDAEGAFPFAAALSMGTYAWAWSSWQTLFLGVLPVAGGFLILAELALRIAGPRRLRGLPASFLVAVVGPAFVVATASLPPPGGLSGSRMGWFALLVILTELNDASQAWWGRSFGRLPLAPRISPAKTWEGLVGGIVSTVIAAVVFAPFLTSWGRVAPQGTASGAGGADGLARLLAWPWIWSAGLGLVVALSGTAGDLFASYLKRRAGVKDSGSLIPGQGGVLDRFDSLSWTAPVYFAATWLLWFHGR